MTSTLAEARAVVRRARRASASRTSASRRAGGAGRPSSSASSSSSLASASASVAHGGFAARACDAPGVFGFQLPENNVAGFSERARVFRGPAEAANINLT